MLYDLDRNSLNHKQWFPQTWGLITKRLTPREFNGVIIGIDRLMIGTHDKVTVPGFKAGANWSGLPWNILWHKAALFDEELAAKMLGLMAMHAFKVHHDDWVTAKTHYAGHEHSNRIYFLMVDCYV